MEKQDQLQEKLVEVEGTLEDVLTTVQSITAHTFQTPAPVQAFTQGDRVMVSTALPVKLITRILYAESATTNRPLDHAQGLPTGR